MEIKEFEGYGRKLMVEFSCTDYEIVENAEDDKRIYYIQNGNAFMVRFSIIVFRCDNYIPET